MDFPFLAPKWQSEHELNHFASAFPLKRISQARIRGIVVSFPTNSKIRAAIGGMLTLFLAGTVLATDLAGRASVIDADTIEIHGQRIRLHGVDAPEKGQECFQPDDSPWRCGQKGALALADFIGDSPVSCQPVDTDRYGRVVANCHVHGRDIGEWLVGEGWAMAYRRYSSDYIGAEQAAKNAKRGIWVGTVQPPWDWRRERRDR